MRLKSAYFQNVWKSGPVTQKFKVLNLSIGKQQENKLDRLLFTWPQTSPGETDFLRAEKSIQSVCQAQVCLEQLLPISDK